MDIYILKHNLLCPYNVAHTYVFRADHLPLDNQLVFSFIPVKATSPAPGFPQLWIVPCMVEASRLFHAVIFVQLMFGLSYW